MNNLTEHKSFRFTKQQIETFKVLEQYDVDIAYFVREAIREKIQREWPKIKKKIDRKDLPDFLFDD
ncbi:MAG: hypothetical protein WC389_21190 [Lutibacter sp.]|jgi:hypothetical protein